MDNKNKHIDQSQFKFVDINERIFDTKFEGKPRSFLSDALIRFAKNKVNLVATTIVLMVVLLSILVPILTPKDYLTPMSSNTTFLPPRVPFLENFGIFDGTIEVTNFRADLDDYILIDPSKPDTAENRLYNPKYEEFNKFSTQFIKQGTLTNSTIIGGKKEDSYVGGTNLIIINSNRSNHIIADKEVNKFYIDNIITVDIASLTEGTTVELYVRPSNINDRLPAEIKPNDSAAIEYYTLIGSMNQAGVYEFDTDDVEINITADLFGTLILVYRGEPNARAEFNSIFIDTSGTDRLVDGYNLSQWLSVDMNTPADPSGDTFGGAWIRANAVYTVASFTYYKYNDIFQDVQGWLSNEEYDALLDANPGMSDSIIYNDPNDHSKGWKFGTDKEYDLVEVLFSTTPELGPDGKYYFNYRVLYNGLKTSGYDTMPYFLFGTDEKGRDLFAEIWLSLRTSLILGLLVSIINIVIGIIWGSISGYFGGIIDFAMERFVEVWSSFPGLTILTILYLTYGAGFGLLLLYLTYSGWIGVAGLTRVQFYRYRGREYVLASRTLGASDWRLIFKHILPNGIGYIITSVILSVPAMILTEASLSFLGFGLGEGAVLDFGIFKLSGLSLGIILYIGQQNMLAPGRFYLVLIPSIIIIIIMIAFNLFGNALRDAMNPSLRGQE